ncbi:MAG: DrmB family protein [Pseudonocardiaceae bacterium]
MALRSGKHRGEGREQTRQRLGAVRRTQLITTYGVGSMIAVGDQSFIVSGLDTWKVGQRPDLQEFRLQTRLGVKGFHLPPSSDPPAGDGVRVRRFPEMYTCPGSLTNDGCEHNLRPYREFNSPTNKSECAACGEPLTPSRFVVACEHGHLDDFPYWEWVHVGRPRGRETSTHRLSFRTTGRTASLRSIIIRCSCEKEVSMEGAFSPSAMKSIKYTCRSGRPWLGRDAREQECSQTPRTLQRGSSAAWFPVVRSALSIPPFSQQLHDEVHKYYPMWQGEDDSLIIRQAEKAGIIGDRYSAAAVIQAVRDYESYEAGERTDPSVISGFEAADVLRVEEYRQLSHEADTPHFACARPTPDPDAPAPSGIGRTMLVKRLREVRALQTFTRVQAPTEGDQKERLAALSLDAVDWLPGVEVIGEGVFLRLDDTLLRQWESPDRLGSSEPRARQIRNHHNTLLRKKARSGRQVPESPVSARFVLLHTLAHAMINEWSLGAGYPASALRERLYVSGDMAGVLIYTATSDSAGSLGGLVSQGEPRYLKNTLESALQRIEWCSTDPLCMESEAAGADSLNLAACHACVLIPETSCETNNNFLDRAMLIGTPDGRTDGYFSWAESER